MPYAKLSNPQTLNLYSYVGNNPLTGIDADGHYSNGSNGQPCGWYGFTGGGLASTMTAAQVPCSVSIDNVEESGAAGAALAGSQGVAQCPANGCSGFDASGNYLQFWATAGGAQGYLGQANFAGGLNEANGVFLTNAQYTNYLKIAYASEIAGQFNRVVEGLGANGYKGTLNIDKLEFHGSRFSFFCSGDCPAMGRYDYGIHALDGGYIHADTVAPWTGKFSFGAIFTGNFWEHGWDDYIGGSLGALFGYAFPQ